MGADPTRDKLDDLDARIRRAEGKQDDVPTVTDATPMKFSRIGFDFVGSVLGCALLGWLTDVYIGTKPWGVVAMIVIGFGVGIVNMWRALAGSKTD